VLFTLLAVCGILWERRLGREQQRPAAKSVVAT